MDNAKPNGPKLPVLFVVSDGRGETCSQVVQAALVQFEGQEIDLVVRGEIRTPEQVSAVVKEAADREATIFYTLVTPDARWAMSSLAEQMLVPTFDNPVLSAQHDGARLDIGPTRLAMSTDSFVINPIFFPGGDIGSLAVHGTVNDLAMCGARPLALSAALILEEGLAMEGHR